METKHPHLWTTNEGKFLEHETHNNLYGGTFFLFFFLRAHNNHTGPLRPTLNESKYVTIKQIGRAFLCDIIDP